MYMKTENLCSRKRSPYFNATPRPPPQRGCCHPYDIKSFRIFNKNPHCQPIGNIRFLLCPKKKESIIFSKGEVRAVAKGCNLLEKFAISMRSIENKRY